MLRPLLLAFALAFSTGILAPLTRAQDIPIALPVEREIAAPQIVWPQRLPLPHAHPREQGILIPIDPTLLPVAFPAGDAGVNADDQRRADRDLLAAAFPDRDIAFEGRGSYAFYFLSPPETNADLDPKTRRLIPAQLFRVLTARKHAEGIHAERTWFAIHRPAPGTDYRGTVLLMPGIFGEPKPFINRLIPRLKRDGYTVVHMLAQSARFTEQRRFDIDNTPEPAAVAEISAEMTQRVAECAYAVEVAMNHADRTWPDLAKLPILAIGMSGGAMTLPPILARDPDRYAAAIMIAGGAELLSLTDLSAYKQMIGALDFFWTGGPPTDERRRVVSEHFLTAMPLDPYHTAAAIAPKRLLIIHGKFDAAVPAANGELLWQRLGRPERWTVNGGHEAVFMWANQNVSALTNWLKNQSPTPKGVTIDGNAPQ
jgi:hypothetical protein